MSLFLHHNNDFFFPSLRPRPSSHFVAHDDDLFMAPFDPFFINPFHSHRYAWDNQYRFGMHMKRPNTVIAILPVPDNNGKSQKKPKTSDNTPAVDAPASARAPALATSPNNAVAPANTDNKAEVVSLLSSSRLDDAAVKDLGSHFQIQLSIPNLKSSDLKITFVKQVMTIEAQAEKKIEQKTAGGHFISHATSSIMRSWVLPAEVDAERLVVSYDKSILQVNLPKKALVAADTKAEESTSNGASASTETVLNDVNDVSEDAGGAIFDANSDENPNMVDVENAQSEVQVDNA